MSSPVRNLMYLTPFTVEGDREIEIQRYRDTKIQRYRDTEIERLRDRQIQIKRDREYVDRDRVIE
jgi:hypothetical protein